MAITGNGNASKERVAKMLQSLLNIKEMPKNLDATDGLAAAVCHFFSQGRLKIIQKPTNGRPMLIKSPKLNQVDVRHIFIFLLAVNL